MRRHHTKPDVVVEVVDRVVVANRTADVPMIIVERPAPQHAALIGRPYRQLATTELYPFSKENPRFAGAGRKSEKKT